MDHHQYHNHGHDHNRDHDPNQPDMGEIEADILKNMLASLFGDTSDYIGHSIAMLPERRRANVVRICTHALKRIGKTATSGYVPDPNASVPPRVAGCLLEQGSWVRDAASSAYWAGILAASRTANPRDDRAARHLQLLSRLGEYDIRTHYLFYSTLRLLLVNTRRPESVDFQNNRFGLSTFIPAGFYILAMDYNRDEIARSARLIASSLYALGQELLVDGSNSGGDAYLQTQFKRGIPGVIKGEGIVFSPSVIGLHLFLWVFGRHDNDLHAIMDPHLDCRIDGVQMGIDEAGLIYK